MFWGCRDGMSVKSKTEMMDHTIIAFVHFYQLHFSPAKYIWILFMCIGNHTHSSAIKEIIVLAIVKIGWVICMCNYSLIGQERV